MDTIHVFNGSGKVGDENGPLVSFFENFPSCFITILTILLLRYYLCF